MLPALLDINDIQDNEKRIALLVLWSRGTQDDWHTWVTCRESQTSHGKVSGTAQPPCLAIQAVYYGTWVDPPEV